MGTAKALRQVELLARLVVARLEHGHMTGECDAECGGSRECPNEVTGQEKCPKCGEMVDFSTHCDALVECDDVCNNDITLELEDDDNALLRELRLALVQLDIARSNETPSIYEAGDR
jgi:hypothetical protein